MGGSTDVEVANKGGRKQTHPARDGPVANAFRRPLSEPGRSASRHSIMYIGCLQEQILLRDLTASERQIRRVRSFHNPESGGPPGFLCSPFMGKTWQVRPLRKKRKNLGLRGDFGPADSPTKVDSPTKADSPTKFEFDSFPVP